MLKFGVKRFYKSVEVRVEPSGFAILLDGRPIKTPAGRALLAPTRALAEAIAAEWRGQGETILPDTMPLTKSLNTALDRMAPNRAAIIDDLVKYVGADLLCYRAEKPAELVRQQAAAWDPWLDWAAERYGVRLGVTSGVTHIAQSDDAVNRLRHAMVALDDNHLVALHTAVTITGSAILGLAFTARAVDADTAFAVAQVDDAYQGEQWGRDADAEAVRTRRLDELRAAQRYLELLTIADPS
jgi:chaperone required for assembly of F1-ATPase